MFVSFYAVVFRLLMNCRAEFGQDFWPGEVLSNTTQSEGRFIGNHISPAMGVRSSGSESIVDNRRLHSKPVNECYGDLSPTVPTCLN
jgi:hypothetical protein